MEWNLIHACAQGRGHLRDGTPCQDATAACQSTDGRITALALSDGAGSCPLSHHGAQAVTQAVTELLCEHFAEFYACPDANAVRQTILTHLQNTLAQTAEQHHCTPDALACTLLFAASCEDRFLIGHIGDGVIGCMENGTVRVLSRPMNGEFLNTTCFVTSPHALRHFRLFKAEKPSLGGLFLMSDGSEQALYQRSSGTLSAAVQDLARLCVAFPPEQLQPQLQALLQNDITAATTDDCSLALMARPTPEFRGLSSFPPADLCALLDLPAGRIGTPRRLRTTLSVLHALQDAPCSRMQLARRFRLHPRRMQRILLRLQHSGCAVCTCGRWYSPLR